MSRYLLEADSVVKRFGDRLILKSASIRVEPQRITALLGRNGTGKSTLLRILCGMMSPDAGSVRIDGEARESFSLSWLANRGVFYLPDRDLLHPKLSVRAQLETALRMRGILERRDRIVETFAISHCIDLRPNQLSGGERRRAEFAFALACKPRVLIADEPLRGIPPVDGEQILYALRAFANDGCATLLTGHEVNLIMPHVDRMYWCVAGTTRQFDSPLDALGDFAFRQQFLVP